MTANQTRAAGNTIARSSLMPSDAIEISYILNGTPVSARVEPRQLLVHHLREDRLLTGTHVGCDTSQCGACAVHIDGRVVKSCNVLACQVDGAQITTIEGVSGDAENGLHRVQDALRRHHGLQCGFCTPGMVMTILELIGANRPLTEDEVRHGLSGNICRCTGYQNIVDAIVEVSAESGQAGEAGAGTEVEP
jgi:carbon-monoxide dehydrogenase small subunit